MVQRELEFLPYELVYSKRGNIHDKQEKALFRRTGKRRLRKVIILKRHLVDRIAVSDLCDEYHISPTIFYRWQKQFFEKGAMALESKHKSNEAKKDRQIKELTQKLQNKHEVVSELMEAHLRLKKSLGET